MKKILYAFLMSLVLCAGVRAEGLVDDTSDPLFLTARGRRHCLIILKMGCALGNT